MLIITVQIFSLCWQIFPCVRTKFPVFSLSGKSKNQIPCFPCAVATLFEFHKNPSLNMYNLYGVALHYRSLKSLRLVSD